MSGPPRIVTNRHDFLNSYHRLEAGDIICGKIPLISGEESLFIDLISRRINLIPPATAQMASRSKCFQAELLKPWMIAETTAIYNLQQLLEQTNVYAKKSIGKVIVKLDKKNAGRGILLYDSIEDVYNQAAHNCVSFPFVLQPFLPDCRDLRVILLGEYREAYTRDNPYSFRNNLHCGGKAAPSTLTEHALKICQEVMTRAGFPYGHLDLLLTPEENIYLAEVNLRGGIRGAQISTEEYRKKVAAIEKQLLNDLVKDKGQKRG